MSDNETLVHDSSAFLVLGGCGFIGRHMVALLARRARAVYVIDKTPPQLAWLNEQHYDLFTNNPKVVFVSCNLINPVSCEKAFQNINDDIDYVINLAAEARSGQSDEVYKDGIYKLTTNVVQQVHSKFGDNLKRYVQFSTGQMYAKDKVPHTEDSSVDEWNSQTTYHHQAEQHVKKVLKNFIIIRPAIVYGIGDKTGITPRLIIGAVYKYLGETMKLPWTADIQTNTVHVEDVVRATYHLLAQGKAGNVYNLVDEGNTTHGYLSDCICGIFGIKHDYVGTTLSNLVKLNLKEVVEDINEKHSEPWAALCAANGVQNTPLTPFINSEFLAKRHLSVDGSKVRGTGYTFRHPRVTDTLLRQVLTDFAQNNLFPKSFV